MHISNILIDSSGNDSAATTHLAGTGYTVTNGNGNGQIAEYFAAPQHLAAAGFITGNYDGTSDYIKHTYGGNVLIYYQTIQGKTGNLIRFDNLSAENAKYIDSAFDEEGKIYRNEGSSECCGRINNKFCICE